MRRPGQAFGRVQDFLFLGRGIHYPIALEGALKLKEISYIHAEGYPAGEMKHGPNALIDENLPVVIIATRDLKSDPDSMLRYEKTMSNLKEVKARSGVVIALATEGDEEIKESADHVLYVPPRPEELSPDPGNRSVAIAGLSHRGAPRLRCGSAEESGEVGDGRVVFMGGRLLLSRFPSPCDDRASAAPDAQRNNMKGLPRQVRTARSIRAATRDRRKKVAARGKGCS